ncbi:hypothetical protein JKP75_01655 [Blastococcus sp. TML/M2B]|uniref:type VII secretion target n=1 Tax=unclassified Blastococcus TaxID=2619396 RepID=UPI00190A9BBF|nr:MULTISPECIES: hypothetical protein [unclassified Blastococcus]MBN1091406.1 hypothetical protein [Blastococcus sp. TML/M2B]MBN1095037.1 hypothetical protein [Blastococcus sp. TML/C7B]
MAPRISVHPGELAALADELSRLARTLAEDGDRCRVAAGTLTGALGGREGAAAGAVADRWAVLAGALAEGTGVVADAIRSAVEAYAAVDRELAGRMDPP